MKPITQRSILAMVRKPVPRPAHVIPSKRTKLARQRVKRVPLP